MRQILAFSALWSVVNKILRYPVNTSTENIFAWNWSAIHAFMWNKPAIGMKYLLFPTKTDIIDGL